MGDFVAYNSRWRVTLLFLGAVVAVAAGLWLVGAFGEVPRWRHHSAGYTMSVGWLCTLLSGFCAVAIAKKFFDGRVQLQVGPAGIVWSRWSDQLIPWSEITDVSTWSYRGQKVIILHLNNPDRFPGRGLAAKLAGANRMLMGGDIAISLTGTDRSYDDAMSAIAHFRR
jgi:hypothetical protein